MYVCVLCMCIAFVCVYVTTNSVSTEGLDTSLQSGLTDTRKL